MKSKGALLAGVIPMPSPPPITTQTMKERHAKQLSLQSRMREAYEAEEKRREQTADLIKDQIARDIEALGACGPIVLDVWPNGMSYQVKFLQWQSNNLAGIVLHDFILRDGCKSVTEALLREWVTRRFAKILRWQAQKCAELGTPKKTDPKDIDLSAFTNDAPFAAMLEDSDQDQSTYLRSVLTASRNYSLNRLFERKTSDHFVEDIDASFSRSHIHGKFITGNDTVTLKWSKGTLAVFGLDVPTSIMMVYKGKELQEVIQHPWFTHPMTITAVTPTRWSGKDGFVLDLRNTDIPVPSHW